MTTATYPKCPMCGREFKQGIAWNGANYCRAAFLATVVDKNPDLSAWELSQITRLSYADTTKGLTKARDWNLVETTPEEREQGGIRYRYRLSPEATGILSQWAEDHARLTEPSRRYNFS